MWPLPQHLTTHLTDLHLFITCKHANLLNQIRSVTLGNRRLENHTGTSIYFTKIIFWQTQDILTGKFLLNTNCTKLTYSLLISSINNLVVEMENCSFSGQPTFLHFIQLFVQLRMTHIHATFHSHLDTGLRNGHENLDETKMNQMN